METTTTTLVDIIERLKSGCDKVFVLKQTTGATSEDVIGLYRTELLPDLLKLRAQNRLEKDQLEEKCENVKKLFDEFNDLQEICDSFSFMVSSIKSDVVSQRKQDEVASNSPVKRLTNGISTPSKESADDIFDLDSVIKLDHETRMRMLDEEERRRRDLQEQLSQSNADIKAYEISCTQSTSQMNEVKPHIKLFIDKVAPILQQPSPKTPTPVVNIE